MNRSFNQKSQDPSMQFDALQGLLGNVRVGAKDRSTAMPLFAFDHTSTYLAINYKVTERCRRTGFLKDVKEVRVSL
jgi:hypothetical protein